MKSSNKDLCKRGFFTIDDIYRFQLYSDNELILQINSPIAVERSIAINLLSSRFLTENLDFVKLLLERLCIEKCLYTKIEICNALEKGSTKTAEQMVAYLGCIGTNQHRYIPEKVSQKKSYPLPRDIIARTLGRMDFRILPVLFDVLNSNNQEKISEVIDAIGFLLFYHPSCVHQYFFEAIIKTISNYSENSLIVWKCVCCLSAFRTQDSIEALHHILNNNQNGIIICEAKRSLKLIGNT